MVLPLLDAGGAGLYFIVFALFVFFIIAAILVEAGVMMLLKYQTGFKKSFIDSLVANLASLAVGFMLFEVADDFFESYGVLSLIVLYVITVLIETPVLYLLNKSKPVKRLVITSLAMNLVTYLILALIVSN